MPSLHSRSSSATLVLALFLCGVAAHAQTFTVIHTFSGGGDGGTPSGLTLDAAGNVYGAATNGGINEPFGAAFRLKNSGAGWVLNPLYEFSNEGGAPAFPGVLTLASDGSFSDRPVEAPTDTAPSTGCSRLCRPARRYCATGT